MKEASPPGIERKLWFDGPNLTADAIVIDPTNQRILLIRRRDTGEWALLGGFIDSQDNNGSDAAKRELAEETGLEIEDTGTLVFQGIVDDPRNTPGAWIETSAYLFVASDQLEVNSGDDACDVQWHNLTDLPTLYASHEAIIEHAARYLAASGADDLGARGSGVWR